MAEVPLGLVRGPDGIRRCGWGTSTDDYVRYHDEEWGRPTADGRELFERLTLEAFQSGLSWLTILRKREGFRAAFAGFDTAKIARFGARDVKQLLADEAIVRNRAKIDATINNARAAEELNRDGVSFGGLVWSFRSRRREAPRRLTDVPASTPGSKALSKELKRRGFVFVGPTTAYALMQACGLVNDHLLGCGVRGEVERERRPLVRRHRGWPEPRG
jgi:DNA-3-methyladenine glycosylase I